MFAPQSIKSVLRQGEFYRKLEEDILSHPSHSAASRISAMWKAHKGHALAHPNVPIPEYIGIDLASSPDASVEAEYGVSQDRNIELRRIRSLPPLTPLQASD